MITKKTTIPFLGVAAITGAAAFSKVLAPTTLLPLFTGFGIGVLLGETTKRLCNVILKASNRELSSKELLLFFSSLSMLVFTSVSMTSLFALMSSIVPISSGWLMCIVFTSIAAGYAFKTDLFNRANDSVNGPAPGYHENAQAGGVAVPIELPEYTSALVSVAGVSIAALASNFISISTILPITIGFGIGSLIGQTVSRYQTAQSASDNDEKWGFKNLSFFSAATLSVLAAGGIPGTVALLATVTSIGMSTVIPVIMASAFVGYAVDSNLLNRGIEHVSAPDAVASAAS